MSHAPGPRHGTGTERWVRSAFGLLARLPGVRRVGVGLVEGGGRRLSFAASDRGDEGDTDWCEVDAFEDVPLNNTIRTGRLIAGSREDLVVRYAEFVARQDDATMALASVPLVGSGRVLGGFALFYEEPQSFDDHQLEALRRLGERLGAELRRGQRGTRRPRRSLADEPVPAGAAAATHVVDADPQEVAGAREFVRSTLSDWGVVDDVSDRAVLCVSELVTNAIIHTPSGCEVGLVLDRRLVIASVRDEGSPMAQQNRAAGDPLAVHGRGLHLVEALSKRWGSDLDTGGMTVWCEFDAG